MMNSPPIPRLCVLEKPDASGEYGFNLHAEKGKGQFVGAVDPGSAAAISGLLPGDHIIAVNGETIDGFSHKEVVQRIKSNPSRCSLLVIDDEGVQWYKEHNRTLSADILSSYSKGAKGMEAEDTEQKEYLLETTYPGETVPADGHVHQLPNGQQHVEFAANGGAVTNDEESGSCSLAMPESCSSNSPPAVHNNGSQSRPTTAALLVEGTTRISMPQTKQKIPAVQQRMQHSANSPSDIRKSPPLGNPFDPQSPPAAEEELSLCIGQTITTATIGPYAALPQHKKHLAAVPPPVATEQLLAQGPKPRLCILSKASPNDEFGFNLHAERGKGHFIGAVDRHGLADKAGLETGQRIVGVNGRLVYPNTPHKEVVSLIKQELLSTELLVASEEVERFYADNKLAFSYSFVNIFDPSLRSFNKANPIGQINKNASSEPPSFAHQQSLPLTRTTSGQKTAKMWKDFERNDQSMSKRAGTPTSTYTSGSTESEKDQQKDDDARIAAVEGVQVQIERRPDNRTSIEIAESPTEHLLLKSENSTTTSVTVPSNNMSNGNGVGRLEKRPEGEKDKHVIADDQPHFSPADGHYPSATAVTAPIGLQSSHPIQKGELPTMLESPNSSQSRNEKKKANTLGPGSGNLFELSAEEARKAICGRKKDPRLQSNMTLEEKYRLILNL